MEYWRSIVKNPTGIKATDEFAVVMDNIPKIVFSRTLKNIEWESARLADQDLEQEVSELKQQTGRDILIGSPGLIDSLTKLNLIDEYQLCVHPVVAGDGLRLFKDVNDKIIFKLLKTKTFGDGAVIFYYERAKSAG